ncbi:MAG: DUF4956 domain-containing protein [Syntrophomonas sp.]
MGETLTISKTLLIVLAALVCGLAISQVYIFTHKKEAGSQSFTISLIMLPAIVAIIILLIGDNIARAFSLAGAFSLIRFRSAPGEPEDIAYIFFTLAVGLACGMGYIGYSGLFTIILGSVMLILYKSKYASSKCAAMLLKVSVPENLNYEGLLDDILDCYTNTWQMSRVKTSQFGTLFTLFYTIEFKKGCSQKTFLDELRCRNGNLDITLTRSDFDY